VREPANCGIEGKVRGAAAAREAGFEQKLTTVVNFCTHRVDHARCGEFFTIIGSFSPHPCRGGRNRFPTQLQLTFAG
jgi:hypothetical protein